MTSRSDTETPKTATLEAAGFYEEALTEAERLRLPRAQGVKGIDDEIALLRVRLLGYAERNPEKLDVLMQGVALLTRAVAVRYRLSPKSQQDLMENIIGVAEGLGRSFGMGDFGAEGKDDGV